MFKPTVTVKSTDQRKLMLNNQNITATPQHNVTVGLAGADYSILTYNISAGSHVITTQNAAVRFGLMIFGHRPYDGYGYVGNMLIGGNI